VRASVAVPFESKPTPYTSGSSRTVAA
jgi:hypothetical protein